MFEGRYFLYCNMHYSVPPLLKYVTWQGVPSLGVAAKQIVEFDVTADTVDREDRRHSMLGTTLVSLSSA